MTDSEDRAERAFRDAFERHSSAYDPVELDLERIHTPPRRSRLLRPMAVAVAVLVLAGGISLGARELRADDSSGSAQRPGGQSETPSSGAVAPSQLAAENARRRHEASAEAEGVLSRLPVPVGAERVTAREVSPLIPPSIVLGSVNTSLVRSDFWLVPGDPRALARWYARHPPQGMTTAGGPQSVGGSQNADGSRSQNVEYDPTSDGSTGVFGALVDITTVGDRAGVHVRVFASWAPARSTASLVEDVTTVKIRITERGETSTRLISSPTDVQRLLEVYNGLPGTGYFTGSCPGSTDPTSYVLVFAGRMHTVTARFAEVCGGAWQIEVDGHEIDPILSDRGLSTLASELVDGPRFP